MNEDFSIKSRPHLGHLCVCFNTEYNDNFYTFWIMKKPVFLCIQNGDRYVDSGGGGVNSVSEGSLVVPGKKRI